MVNSRSQQLDETFYALSDPTRRAIVERLSHGDCAVADLAEPFDMSLPAISRHLRILQRVGLITQQRIGRVRLCRLQLTVLHELADWVKPLSVIAGG